MDDPNGRYKIEDSKFSITKILEKDGESIYHKNSFHY